VDFVLRVEQNRRKAKGGGETSVLLPHRRAFPGKRRPWCQREEGEEGGVLSWRSLSGCQHLENAWEGALIENRNKAHRKRGGKYISSPKTAGSV